MKPVMSFQKVLTIVIFTLSFCNAKPLDYGSSSTTSSTPSSSLQTTTSSATTSTSCTSTTTSTTVPTTTTTSTTSTSTSTTTTTPTSTSCTTTTTTTTPSTTTSCSTSSKTISTITKATSSSTSKCTTISTTSKKSTTTSHKKSTTTTTTAPVTESIAPSVESKIFHPTNVPKHSWGPSFIPSGKNGLPQEKTNGKSLLGTFGARRFPKWIGQNGHNKQPWGGRTAQNTNPYTQSPDTGVTQYYDFIIQRGTIAPDGVARDVILVNGQFPGPTIEANWGDMIQVTVHNELVGPEEGTAIHWHGLLQKGTPYMDGIPGITQCPIAPGTTFTYLFKADLYGSSWYHSHYSAQYAGGMFGAMIIHGPTNFNYDIDLGPVLLSDYYHDSYFDIVQQVMGTDLTKIAPVSVNNLINGKGVYNCSLVADPSTCTPDAGLSHFAFETGKFHRLRLINSGAEGIQKFSIDEHTMTVIAQDFVPIQPYTTTVVTLGIGQRVDVIVQANQDPSQSYWMRSTISTCSLSSQPNGLAMIYYPGADTTRTPDSTAWVDSTNPCANDALTETVPFFPITPPPNPATTQEIAINFEVNATGHFVWTMNNSTFRVNYNDPILFLANEGNTSYPYDPEWNVYDFGTSSSIRLVIENLTPVVHPMHMHGHNMYVLAEGAGSYWDGTITNPSNPTRRDVQLVQPNGHIVLQIDADNPGVWPFHCHIAWHVSGGLYINILERPDEIAQMQIPSAVTDTCTSWSAFTASQVVDEIDSGL